jgi:Ser/Thr protein kinase RdoA (MazF antagonist)
MSGAIGRRLGAGNVAEVFEWGERVIKLYRSPDAMAAAFREAAIQAAVERLGLPVPAVWGVQRVGGRWGVVFDRVGGTSFAERKREDPAIVPVYLDDLVRLHRWIHSYAAAELASLKLRMAGAIAATNLLGEEQKSALFEGLADLPDGDRLCHGDFHPMNVLGDLEQPVVIDWPDARRGDPAADVCRSWLLLKLHAEDMAEPYLDAYCRVGDPPREAIFGWLPYIAAARLVENVPGETDRLLAIIGDHR